MAHLRKSPHQPHGAEHFEHGKGEDKLKGQHEKCQESKRFSLADVKSQESKGVPLADEKGQQSKGVPLGDVKGKQSKGVPLAVSAGSMAALGSVCAKLAFSRDLIYDTCVHYLPHNGAPIDTCSDVSISVSCDVSCDVYTICHTMAHQ